MLAERREVLGGLLTVLGGTCCSHQAMAQTSGCWVPQGQAQPYFNRVQGRTTMFNSGREQLEPRSGNRQLDRALAQALGKMSNLFGVLPGFCYYDDGDSANALATSEQLLDRSDGTVMFGLSFLRELLSKPQHGDASVVAVCAHEYGHIVSYKYRQYDELKRTGGTFRVEQFADYFAGYYAGNRKLERPDFPAVVFATTQQSFGGGSHGTGQQRGEAVQAGFLAAYQQRLTPVQARAAGLAFCMGRHG